MNTEARKNQIKRKLILNRYPTRSNAEFTADNDHNPLVLAACQTCRGIGKYDTFQDSPSGRIQSLHYCDDCDGNGVTAVTELYFDNDNDPVPVVARADGWLKCPNCSWRFTITDTDAYTGLRHKRCGQKLIVTRAT